MLPQQPALPLPEHSPHCPALWSLWQQGPHHLIPAKSQGLAQSLAPGRCSNTCCFHWISIISTTSSFERQKPRHSGAEASFPTGSSEWQGQTWRKGEIGLCPGVLQSGLLGCLLSFQSSDSQCRRWLFVLSGLWFLLKCTQRWNSPRNSFESCRENCVLGMKSENV